MSRAYENVVRLRNGPDDATTKADAARDAAIAAIPLAGDSFTGAVTGATVKALAASFDLNTLTRTGSYDVQNPVNGPGAGWWYIESRTHSLGPTQFRRQTARQLDLNDDLGLVVYERTLDGGSWTPWRDTALAIDARLDTFELAIQDGVRPLKLYRDLYGKFMNATLLSVVTNRGDGNREPLVTGDSTDGHLSWYEDFDTVGAYFENRLRKPTRIPFVVFELNSFYIASDASGAHVVGGATQYHSELRVGMFVRAGTTPEKRARITGWDSERVYVAGWVNKGETSQFSPGTFAQYVKVQVGSNVYMSTVAHTSSTQEEATAAGFTTIFEYDLSLERWAINSLYHDPTGTPATWLEINPQTKAWVLNANYFVNSDVLDPLPRGAISEFGIANYKANSPYVWGYDVVNLADANVAGNYFGGTGFICRGDWMQGFESLGSRDSGFRVRHHHRNPAEGGFRYDANSGPAFIASTSVTNGGDQYGLFNISARHVYFQVGNEIDPILIGRNNVAGQRDIWFRSGGGSRNYDSMLFAMSGSPTADGGGVLAAAGTGFRVYDSNFQDHAELRGSPTGGGAVFTTGSLAADSPLVLRSKGAGVLYVTTEAAGGTIQIANTADRAIGFFGSGGAVRQAATDIDTLLTALRAYGLISP